MARPEDGKTHPVRHLVNCPSIGSSQKNLILLSSPSLTKNLSHLNHGVLIIHHAPSLPAPRSLNDRLDPAL